MERFYTAVYIRKSDNKVLRRFQSRPKDMFYWKKDVEAQLNKLLDLYDLDKRDILIREYDGTNDNID